MTRTTITFVLLLALTACAPAHAPTPTKTIPVMERTSRQGMEMATLWGEVLDASNQRRIEEALVQLRELKDVWVGELRHVKSGPDGRYEFQDLPPNGYQLRCEKDGYQPVNLRVKVEIGPDNRTDCPLVRSASIASDPFRIGTLQSLFKPGTPLSGIESPVVDIALDNAQAVSLNMAGLERQMILATLTITNVSESPLYLSLTDSYLVGQTAAGLPDGFYDVGYKYDDVGSQFLPNGLPTGVFWIEEGDSVSGNVGFWDPVLARVADNLENVTPVLCFGWAATVPLEPREFCAHHPQLITEYLPE